MPSFPLVADLPRVLNTRGWEWKEIRRPSHPSDGFWIATDTQRRRWLTKLRGARYAYREITFAKLAQGLGWSCQSSIYIELDARSAVTIGVQPGSVHAAHWYLDEHCPQPCCASCSLSPLIEVSINSIEDLEGIDIAHLLDWPKNEFAAYIFGANETSDRLITSQHELVMIDNEQMFSSGPCDFGTSFWLRNINDSAYRRGLALALETCNDVASISPDALAKALAIPDAIKIEDHLDIEMNIRRSIRFASEYLRVGKSAHPQF